MEHAYTTETHFSRDFGEIGNSFYSVILARYYGEHNRKYVGINEK